MKILVDFIPFSGKDCLFSEKIEFTGKYKCQFKNGLYSRCSLDCNEPCLYLTTNSQYIERRE